MANECLVTKLKGTVSGNLLKLGHVMIPVENLGVTGVTFSARWAQGTPVEECAACYLDSNGNKLVNITIGSTFYGPNAAFPIADMPQNAAYIDLTNKYKLSSFGSNGTTVGLIGIFINIEDIAYCPITDINSYNELFGGTTDVAYFKNFTSMSFCRIFDRTLKGNANEGFGRLKDLTVLEISSKGQSATILGSVEKICEEQLEILEGTKTLKVSHTQSILFKSVQNLESAYSCVCQLSSSGVTITNNAGDLLATYDKTNWRDADGNIYVPRYI